MKKYAIIVGHTNGGDKGAYSTHLGKSEQPYNLEVANALKALDPTKYDVYTHDAQDYHKRQTALAAKLNAKDYEAVIELHFNAASPLANGTEALYYFASKKGKQLAQDLSAAVVKDYGTTLRGAKPLVNRNDRGYWFVYLPKATAVILEPFFGSNAEALKFADPKRLAHIINNVLKS